MPGFNKTGPMGYGSMTGAGRGYCGAGCMGAGHRNFTSNFRRFGRRRGGGYGFGNGWGLGAGPRWMDPMAYESMEADNFTDDIGMLKVRADALNATLAALNRRIDNLAKQEIKQSGSDENA